MYVYKYIYIHMHIQGSPVQQPEGAGHPRQEGPRPRGGQYLGRLFFHFKPKVGSVKQ